MVTLSETGRRQVIAIAEQGMTGPHDDIFIVRRDNMRCFEVTSGNPYIAVARKAQEHYGCSWSAAEDIVARVVGWIAK